MTDLHMHRGKFAYTPVSNGAFLLSRSLFVRFVVLSV